jgi:hypothetical protein
VAVSEMDVRQGHDVQVRPPPHEVQPELLAKDSQPSLQCEGRFRLASKEESSA